MRRGLCCIAIIFGLSSIGQANGDRQTVQLPEVMREHLLSNMRDHLSALEEITRFLASDQYGKAAGVAENRLGMSSLESHGATHMNRFFPQEMGQIGMEMHRAASRFALAAEEAEIEGGLNKAFTALSQVMHQCVACHSAYKVH